MELTKLTEEQINSLDPKNILICMAAGSDDLYSFTLEEALIRYKDDKIPIPIDVTTSEYISWWWKASEHSATGNNTEFFTIWNHKIISI